MIAGLSRLACLHCASLGLTDYLVTCRVPINFRAASSMHSALLFSYMCGDSDICEAAVGASMHRQPTGNSLELFFGGS